VKRSCDDVVGITRIGERNGLPPGQDLLLGPFIGLTEVVVNLEVYSLPKLVRSWGRNGFEKEMQSEFKGVTHDEYHLVILESLCVEFQGLLLCC
jgi:hypothetical protein